MDAIQKAVANNAVGATHAHQGNGSGPAPLPLIETPQVAAASPREKLGTKGVKKDGAGSITS
jgi:hypothetical protein